MTAYRPSLPPPTFGLAPILVIRIAGTTPRSNQMGARFSYSLRMATLVPPLYPSFWGLVTRMLAIRLGQSG